MQWQHGEGQCAMNTEVEARQYPSSYTATVPPPIHEPLHLGRPVRNDASRGRDVDEHGRPHRAIGGKPATSEIEATGGTPAIRHEANMSTMMVMAMKEPSASRKSDALLAAPPNRSNSLASDSTSEVQADGAIRTTANDIALPRAGQPSSTGQIMTRANTEVARQVGVAAVCVTPRRSTAGIAAMPVLVPAAVARHVLRHTNGGHERSGNTKEGEEAPHADTSMPRGDATTRHTMPEAASVPRPRR